MQLLVNQKNLAEVLACYGLMTLATCLNTPVCRCRFTGTKSKFCADNVIRSRMFEFEHPDADTLLNRVAALEVIGVDDCVVLRENGNEVITLDWWGSSSFVGDKGNFSKTDKREFVTLHYDAFKSLIEPLDSTGLADLFALSTETNETNYLANFSQLKPNYVDAGGVYESDDPLFAREFLLLIGLQNFDFMSQLVNSDSVIYGVPVEWTTFAGFAACLSGAAGEKYECKVKGFGKDGLVLATASEVVSFARFATQQRPLRKESEGVVGQLDEFESGYISLIVRG
jgi:hypothetical protein